jgi:hypothetical protein
LQGGAGDKRYVDAIAKAWEDLKSRDPAQLAANSGGELSGRNLMIKILQREAVLNLDSGDIRWSDGTEMKGDFKVILLHYLQNTKGRLEGKLVSYREIEGGNLYYSVFQGRAIIPLVKTFGDAPEKLLENASKLNGKPVKRGDASVDFLFFPYLLVNATLWKGDDEVPSSANVLFDAAVVGVLPAEDVAHLSGDLVQLIIRV